MRSFRDIPIRQKLMLTVMATTTAAMLLAALGIVAADTLLFRDRLQTDLSALARIIGDNSTAALAFDDPASAAQTLATLRARPHVVTACIYRSNQTLFATYSRPGAHTECPAADGREAIRYSGGGLTVAQPILLDGRRIGTLIVLYDLGEIFERVELYSAIVLGVLLISSLIAFLLSSKLRAIIATPISQLVGATTSVSKTNDYSIRAPKLSGDELGVLVDTFNNMLDGIQSRDRNLRTALEEREAALRDAEHARERLRFMAESMPQKIFTATPRGDVEYFNRQWVEYTGLPMEAIMGSDWTQIVHPDDMEPNLEAWRHSLETGEPFTAQHRFRRADGAYRWHLSRVHPMRDGEGNISMWIGSNTEIHEQKEKEEELRRANDDLQQFAYSASHDLQEPIRNVAIYSEIIAKRYHGVLDADGRQFLGFLTEGGRRLATLINDLLAYTRAGAIDDAMVASQTTAVDAAAVLQRALDSLAEAVRESGATVTCEPLPEVSMSATHLQQIFQNLVSNALKYRTDEPPQIHISAGYQGAYLRFEVQDNGIGIDPQYKERIFGVFKRLHRDQKYSGTGIGLAICQRVVERYGGRIWVESAPGKGSTFYFTVPRYSPRSRSATAESSTR